MRRKASGPSARRASVSSKARCLSRRRSLFMCTGPSPVAGGAAAAEVAAAAAAEAATAAEASATTTATAPDDRHATGPPAAARAHAQNADENERQHPGRAG